MIELARHIEILLLENDCVIVPELGGFIAHYQPAYYAESDNIYFPPMRTIGFTPQEYSVQILRKILCHILMNFFYVKI